MLEVKNLLSEVNDIDGMYIYKKISHMNGNVLSVVQVANRTLAFHVHEHSDELFCVLEGAFKLETQDGLIPVKAGEFVVVPMGMPHRPVVTELTKFLMVEYDGTLSKENSGELYKD